MPKIPDPPAPNPLTWKSDLVAGFLVFLIALPLSLGIAMASGFPPIAGVLTAVIGGVVATWLGSAPLTIKGPAAGLIVIALGAVQELGGGDNATGYRRALACIAVAAVVQIAFALARAGTLGDLFPSSVVHGMLAAIGIIICSKQVHTLLGVTPTAKAPLQLLLEIPASVLRLNPEIALIGVLSLVLLFGAPALARRTRWLQKIPAPLLVLAASMPLALAFDLEHEHTYTLPLTGSIYTIGPQFLVNLPGSLAQAIVFPDFSLVTSPASIKYVLMFAMVGSIESLLSTKAVSSLDPERRRPDLDRDLLATGIGNLVAGLLGGLPMISEIVRSSANLGYGARSRLSNFFHGAFLLLFVAFAPGLIHRIPLAALAAMLTFTGIRLASPGELVKTFRIGKEQLVVFVATAAITIATDLLVGVAAGIAVEMLIHVLNGAPLRNLFRPGLEEHVDGGRVVLRVKQAAVFSNYLSIKRRLARHQGAPAIEIDLAGTGLVDHTVMANLHDLKASLAREGRALTLSGLDDHGPMSSHPLSARKRKRKEKPPPRAHDDEEDAPSSPHAAGETRERSACAQRIWRDNHHHTIDMNEPSSKSGADEAPAERLRTLLQHAGHFLPAQGPIGVFVHHNTLHAFQHLPFHDALATASALFEAEPFLSEAEYRAHIASGRIDDLDIEAALAERFAERPDERRGPLSRNEIERLALRFGVEAVTEAGLRWRIAEAGETRRLRPDLPTEPYRRLIVKTERWLADRPDAAARLVDQGGGDPESRAALALWEACRRVPLPPAPPAEPPLVGRVGVDRSHRDLLLALTGEDPAELIDPLFIRLLGAYLDEGVAHWAMPDRAQGLFRAFRRLVLEGSTPAGAHFAGLGAELRRLGASAPPAAIVVAALRDLGVAEDRWEGYVTRVLLELPGWAGLIHRLEHTPGDRPQGSPPASLLEYLAVRLTLARYALRDVARRRLGFEGPLAGLVEHARRAARHAEPPRRSPDCDRPFRLFQLAQLAGLSVAELQPLAAADRIWALEALEALDEVARRRLLHEAYEHHHRVEVLHGIAANLRRPAAERAVVDPRFQVVLCIDDRCEGLRRHFEELSPRHETLGFAGFFGVPIRYRGLDDAGDVSLCPVGVEPAHEIVERPRGEDAWLLRKGRRRRWARLVHALGHGTRTLSRGLLLTPTLGLLSTIPLVGRTLFPRSAARLRRALERRLLPAVPTHLRSPHEDGEPAGSGGAPFTASEKAARVAATLESMGLTRGFAPIVAVLGHGAASVNNPHQSAYDCGACGGRHGGPNARLFAAMANDREVRALLAERGIAIPDGTFFLGGMNNTTTEEIVFYDEHLAPASHRGEIAALIDALGEARKRHAHERCRRFASASERLSPERALAHVEARAVDLSEARPELGHATNAVCVVGHRELTRGLFLDRRAFLVSYDPAQDPTGAILERVLLSAGPVGAGINLEYYFSRVDNLRYGAGTKLPHNLASLLGVMDGSLSDLRTGLPKQMIEIHEPVRLLVIVEASTETAAAICARQPSLRELIFNGWIQLVCVDPATGQIAHLARGAFAPFTPPEHPLPTVQRSADWYAGKRGFLPPAIVHAAAAPPRPSPEIASHAA
ncbi:putative inorganic carbon transporter subunit DabA [Sorangium sp. So ce590]